MINPNALVVSSALNCMDTHELKIWVSEPSSLMKEVWLFNMEFDVEFEGKSQMSHHLHTLLDTICEAVDWDAVRESVKDAIRDSLKPWDR